VEPDAYGVPFEQSPASSDFVVKFLAREIEKRELVNGSSWSF
jgi:hypothetical protein